MLFLLWIKMKIKITWSCGFWCQDVNEQKRNSYKIPESIIKCEFISSKHIHTPPVMFTFEIVACLVAGGRAGELHQDVGVSGPFMQKWANNNSAKRDGKLLKVKCMQSPNRFPCEAFEVRYIYKIPAPYSVGSIECATKYKKYGPTALSTPFLCHPLSLYLWYLLARSLYIFV